MSKAGQFRDQIIISATPTLIDDGLGGTMLSTGAGSFDDSDFDASWDTDDTILATPVVLYAKVQQLQAKELLMNGKLVYKQPYKITVRYNTTIQNTQHITWNGVEISINSIISDVRKAETILTGYANR